MSTITTAHSSVWIWLEGSDLCCRSDCWVGLDGLSYRQLLSAWCCYLVGDDSKQLIALKHGGVATSGDARRFLLKDGVRYSHILNPRTGWPTPGAP